MAIVPSGIGPRTVGTLLVAVACAMLLTVPSTAATTSQVDRPAIMRMEYTVGDLTGVVHAPRTLVGELPLVFDYFGYDAQAQELARQGFIVVLVRDPAVLTRHLEMWRDLHAGSGPLVERFAGFARHFAVAEP
ncbi:hypothetical protein SK803_35040 [Lentzea sp. BCCO 10_0856]|uniref:Dienelactone hydrolase n=1 Tax=Lentzea miocenica TaxID=3095431 RepID=A0ABU4TB94_9PSEU|nr:hypothetical protein [Lentzea sp. BCCO 10_0856]MDX8035452.1 hypothetical protein [Lentzea sp. BCCO 10_0856]